MRSLKRAFHLYREKGFLSATAHIHRVALVRFQEALYARDQSISEVVSTDGIVELNTLEIESGNKEKGTRYVATPRLVIEWLHTILPCDPKNWVFIDLGAGRGRVVLEAARRPYRRVVGVEFARELALQAKQNILCLAGPAIRAADVQIIHADVTEFDIPQEPSIFYLYAPFTNEVLELFIKRVEDTYRRGPYPIVFTYLNPSARESALDMSPFFQPVRLRLSLRLKFKFLNPHPVKIYATKEAMPFLRG